MATAAAVSVALGLAGWLPTRRLAGPAALPALIAGCSTGFVATVLGAVPVVLGRGKAQPMVLALGAMGVRLGVVAFLGLGLALAVPMPSRALLIWIALSYLALLPLETRFILKLAAEPPARDEESEEERRAVR